MPKSPSYRKPAQALSGALIPSARRNTPVPLKILLCVALLPLSGFLASCSLFSEPETVETRIVREKVPQYHPRLPTPPAPVEIQPQVLTLEDARYFAEACDAWRQAGEPGFLTEKALQKQYPGLSREDACNWAIFGLTSQDWLTLESYITELRFLIDRLYGIAQSYREQGQ